MAYRPLSFPCGSPPAAPCGQGLPPSYLCLVAVSSCHVSTPGYFANGIHAICRTFDAPMGARPALPFDTGRTRGNTTTGSNATPVRPPQTAAPPERFIRSVGAGKGSTLKACNIIAQRESLGKRPRPGGAGRATSSRGRSVDCGGTAPTRLGGRAPADTRGVVRLALSHRQRRRTPPADIRGSPLARGRACDFRHRRLQDRCSTGNDETDTDSSRLRTSRRVCD